MTALNSNRTLEIESPHSLPFLSSAFPLSPLPFHFQALLSLFSRFPVDSPAGKPLFIYFFLNQIDLMAALGLLITPA